MKNIFRLVDNELCGRPGPNHAPHEAGSRRFLASALLGALLSACSSPVGNEYTDLDKLAMSTEWQDWVVVGSFGPAGPFTLVETKRCSASTPCHFAHDGQGHTYDGFDGFELMVLRLESAQGDISHVVMRSGEKVDD